MSSNRKKLICMILSFNIFCMSTFFVNKFNYTYNSYSAVTTGTVITAAAVTAVVGFFAYNFLKKTDATAPNETFEEWSKKKANVDFVANMAKVQAIGDVIANKKVKDNEVEFSSGDLNIINSNIKNHLGDIVTGNNLKNVPNDAFLIGNVNDFINISESISALYEGSRVSVYLEPTNEKYFIRKDYTDRGDNFGSNTFSKNANSNYMIPLRRLNIGYIVTEGNNISEEFTYFINGEKRIIGYNDYLNKPELNDELMSIRIGSYNHCNSVGNIYAIEKDSAFFNVPFPSLLSSLSYMGDSVLTWENFFQNTTKTAYSKILEKTNAISTPTKIELELDKIKDTTDNISVSLDNIGADTKKSVGFLGKILDAIGSMLGALGGWFSKVFEKLASLDIISSILNAILSAFNWVKDFLTTMIDGILAGIKTVFKWAFDFSDISLVDYKSIAWLTSIFLFIINTLKLLLSYSPNSPDFTVTIPWWQKTKTVKFNIDDFFSKLNFKGTNVIEVIRYLNDFVLCLFIGFKFTKLTGGDN